MTETSSQEPVLILGASSATQALSALLQSAGHSTSVETKIEWIPSLLTSLRPTFVLIAADFRISQCEMVYQSAQLAAAAQGFPVVAITPTLDASRALDLLSLGYAGIVQTPCSKERTLQLLAFFSGREDPNQRALAIDPRPSGALLRLIRHAQIYGWQQKLMLKTKTAPLLVEITQGQVASISRGELSGQVALQELMATFDQSSWTLHLEEDAPKIVPTLETPPASYIPPLPFKEHSFGPPLLPPTREQRNALPPLRVLLADDDPSLLELYSKMLTDDDFVVVDKLSDGKSALEATISIRPDVVISDAMMPIKDGWTFLTELRSDYRIHDTPFLMLSCQGDYLSKLVDLGVGAEDYLQKGIRAKEIKRRLKDALKPRLDFLAALDVTRPFSGDSVKGLQPRFLLHSLGKQNATGLFQYLGRGSRYHLEFLDGSIQKATSNHEQGNSGVSVLLKLFTESGGTFGFSPQSVMSATTHWSIKEIQDEIAERLNNEAIEMLDKIISRRGSLRIVDTQKKDSFLAMCTPVRRQRAEVLLLGDISDDIGEDLFAIRALLQQMLQLGVVDIA
ncbi:MAG: response regulator [Deltaproteobacteria bacterium]|nr:response regulator [Deltaproteobacteria bacterium]